MERRRVYRASKHDTDSAVQGRKADQVLVHLQQRQSTAQWQSICTLCSWGRPTLAMQLCHRPKTKKAGYRETIEPSVAHATHCMLHHCWFARTEAATVSLIGRERSHGLDDCETDVPQSAFSLFFRDVDREEQRSYP